MYSDEKFRRFHCHRRSRFNVCRLTKGLILKWKQISRSQANFMSVTVETLQTFPILTLFTVYDAETTD